MKPCLSQKSKILILLLWTLRRVDQKYVGSSEMWCWRRMEISWNDRVRNEEASQIVKQKKNFLHK